MNYLPRRDEFDRAKKRTPPKAVARKVPLSMFEAVANYQGDKEGFTIEDIKTLTGVMWNQPLWDWLAKESFKVDAEGVPVFDTSIKRWVYCP